MDFSQNLWSFDKRKCFKASQGLCIIAKYPVRAIEIGALHYFQVVESGERGIGGDLVKFLQDLHKGHHVQAPATRTFCLSVPTQCTELNYMPYQLSLPPSSPFTPILLDWLSMSSNSSSRMAATVLDGVVTGILILTLLPWQVTTLPESVLSLLSASSLGLPSLPESPKL